MTFSIFLEEAGKIISLIGIQYFLGRRGSYPYGLLVKFSLIKISLIVIISDVIQTIFLLNFFELFRRFLSRTQFLKKRINKKENESKKKFGERFKKYGYWGLFMISALPYAGGALSGSLLAVSLKMDRRKAFFIIIIGCICSTILYFLIFSGLLELI